MDDFPMYRAAASGLLAMLVGIGIPRFGYAPLVPALIAAHWFTASAAFWLGAANFLGYLLGALGMRSWRRKIHTRPAVVALMAITAGCLLASAWNGGIIYAGLWRLLSGITGGALMVLMGAAVVGRTPEKMRGRVGGITFAGMGAGITLSGLLIPPLLRFGLPATWLLLGGLCLVLTAIVAVLMPPAVITPTRQAPGIRTLTKPIVLLLIGYSLCALGFVPHVLFLASFVAIGLHRGVAAGAGISAVLGLAATLGPLVLGRFADRFGFLGTLAVSYAVMAAAVALPLFTGNPLILAASAAGVGAVALGAVMLTSGALAGMVPANQLAATWGLATMAYAVMQAACAAGFSSLFHATQSYRLLFAIGAVATLMTSGFVVAAQRLDQNHRQ
jgi:predicted MFS family arabinose efflux permease